MVSGGLYATHVAGLGGPQIHPGANGLTPPLGRARPPNRTLPIVLI
jgi:hypothetical protein